MKRNIFLYIAGIVGIMLGNAAVAQSVSGLVTDGSNNEPLPGVTILIKGASAKGTITDFAGEFVLKDVSASDTLTVSSIGYQTQEILVGGRSYINIAMELDIEQLEEVVVIGYGTQKRSNVTGSIASVDAKEITQTPVLRVEQALQGRMSGVQVTSQSGQPGETPAIVIRGFGSQNNAQPIYVVDGFQVSGIDYLNAGDIEKIDVLKDAASAAIYGARGANGVVLITTKSGAGAGTSVEYNAYYGIQNAANQLDVLNATDYAMMMNEGAANAGLSQPYDDPAAFGAGTDWQKELFNKNAPMTNHQLTITGGSEKTSITGSLSYFSQEGIVGAEKSQFDRYTARLNSRTKVSEQFTFGQNLSYSHMKRRSVASNQEFGGLLSNAVNLDPITPLYENDETVLNDPNSQYNLNAAVKNGDQFYGISPYVAQEIVNPLARLAVTHGGTTVDKLVGNIFGEYEFIEGLKFKSSFGLDMGYVMVDGYNPEYYLNAAQSNTNANVSKAFYRTFNWNNENTLTYDKTIGDHHFNIVAGMTVREDRWEFVTASNNGLVVSDPDLVNLAFATDPDAQAGGTVVENALLSNFGRIIYDYKEKYLLTVVMRRDGSTKFGPDKRFGIFPSASFGWVISREDFFPENNIVNFLKFRSSWGRNGSDAIGNYNWVSTIQTGRNYTFRNSSGEEVLVTGASPSRLADPNVGWESSEQVDLGLDVSFFDDQLIVNLDYYRKETKDLLNNNPPTPGVAGNQAGATNVGGILNKGIEWSVTYRKVVDDWDFSIGANMTTINNEVLDVDGGEGVITGASFSTYGTVSRMEKGYPVGYFYGYETDGIFQNQNEVYAHIGPSGDLIQPNAVAGDVRFVDRNGDGAITDDDRTMIGSPHPDFIFGVNGSAAYKGFDFSFLVNGVFGNEIFNGIRRHDLNTTNLPSYMLDRWTGEGTSNEIPRFTWVDANQNYSRISDLYIEDGSFVRVKNVTLGYTFRDKPKGPFKKIHVYVAGENLLTFTKYRGFDPEIGAREDNNGNSSILDFGVDRGIYPQARVMRFGLDVKF